MLVEKLEFYKKQILDELYRLTRDNAEKSGGRFDLYEKKQFFQNSPVEDKIFFDAVWGEINYTYIEIKHHFYIQFTARGIIRYEEKYEPAVTIRYVDLLIPVLIAFFEYERSGQKFELSYIKNFVKENNGINLIDNDIYAVQAILGKFGYLENMYGSHIYYSKMTDRGKAKAIKSIPKSPLDNAIKRISSRLLDLDYYMKDWNECSLKLEEWINQFNEEKEKMAALFLVENLFIATNELSNDIWKQFYNDNLRNLNQEDIYYLAAGGPGSSGESWRHRFIRDLDFGKQQSRSLKAIEEKINSSDWNDKIIIFIDDIIGSGDQFQGFFEDNMMQINDTQKELLPQFRNTKILYFVVIATEKGINNITQKTPLEKENIKFGYLFQKFFDSTNPIWQKTTPITREECLQICEAYGNALSLDEPLGFQDSQLLVAFQDHTPDNTIPLLWWDRSDNWIPLLKR